MTETEQWRYDLSERWRQELSDERRFMEELMNARFNFFLVFVAGIIVAVVSTDDPDTSQWLYVFGIVVSVLLWATIFRSHGKLQLIFEELKKMYPAHPYATIDAIYTKRRCCLFSDLYQIGVWCAKPAEQLVYSAPSVRWLIGWFIPLLCIGALMFGLRYHLPSPDDGTDSVPPAATVHSANSGDSTDDKTPDAPTK